MAALLILQKGTLNNCHKDAEVSLSVINGFWVGGRTQLSLRVWEFGDRHSFEYMGHTNLTFFLFLVCLEVRDRIKVGLGADLRGLGSLSPQCS